MAIESQNTEFYWSNTTILSTVTSCLVGQVVSFSGPTGSAGVIDITTLQSTAKEKMLGLPDEGQISMELFIQTSNAAQVAMRTDRGARTKKKWALKLRDDTTSLIVGDGYCSGHSLSIGVDDAVKLSVTVEITGMTTWTTA